ncbi:hypothetical protein E2562_003771 [Oryza meyeriana var. granulata]|uniref:Uncharacterized protein n=1 Tax=Oryza meyeriana var. granulata TaxID=110450 RepID=A0A6G1BRE6_9ORYZ|nr:hypothetical protein E2562_003771 [Oryza meyeriana var. granulata]
MGARWSRQRVCGVGGTGSATRVDGGGRGVTMGEDQCEAEVDTGSAVTARGLERAVVADSRNAQWSGVQGTTEGDAMNAVPMEAVESPAGAQRSDG